MVVNKYFDIKNALHFSINVFTTKVLIGDSEHQFLHGQPSHAKIYSSAGQTQNIHFSVPSRPWVLVRSRDTNPQPPALQSCKCTTNWANTAADTSRIFSFDPGLHNNRKKKRAFCHMLLNRSLLILKREENHTIQGWHHFFSGLNATEKCKRNEKLKKRWFPTFTKFLRMYGNNGKSHINLRVKPHSTFTSTAPFLTSPRLYYRAYIA